MGTGYTRNDTSNNIADGNIINAADLDGEFDAVESAFNSSTGHTHDGTAAEGGAITVVGPVQDLVVSATEVKPKTTNTLDLGTSALLYKDAYLQGNMYFRDTALKIVSSADGQLDIDADVELELVAPTVDIDASTAVTVDTASTTFTSTLFNVTGSANITGDLDVDNININGNTIISTDTNGNIALTPNGTGEVDISKVDIDSGAIDGTVIGANSAAAITGTTITGTSFVSSGDMTFGDSDKAIFGAGSDLEISHDGTNSFITDVGTGDLFISGSTVKIRASVPGAEDGVTVTGDGAVTLYYDNSPKLATTSGGIDVTGEVQADGLDIAGDGTIDGALTINRSDNSTGLTLVSTDADAGQGPRIDLYRNSSSPAVSDTLGTIVFQGENSASGLHGYGQILTQATNITDTSEEATLVFKVSESGSLRDLFSVGASEVVVNNESRDTDFRVESDNNANMLFIDAGDDSVGIGVGNPSDAANHPDANLMVKGGISFNEVTTASEGSLPAITQWSRDGTAQDLVIGSRSGSGGLLFYTGNTGSEGDWGDNSSVERLRINSDGNVIFNEASADADFRVESNSNTHMLFVDAGNNRIGVNKSSPDKLFHVGGESEFEGTIFVDKADGTAFQVIGNSANTGYINWESNGWTFFTNGPLEALRIGSSEMVINEDSRDYDFRVESNTNANMLLVDAGNNYVSLGTNATDIGSSSSGEGVTYRNGESLRVQRESGAPIIANRVTDDGNLIDLRKNGAGVGGIGIAAGTTYITGNNSYSLMLASDFRPRTADGSANYDDQVDLGDSGSRFKDLYLSGGAYIGGTATANKLDEYEEGIFYYGITLTTSGSYTIRAGYETGRYTKIGNLVHIHLRFETSSQSSPSGDIKLTGLPFTAEGNPTDGNGSGQMPILLRGDTRAGVDGHFCGVLQSSTTIPMYYQSGTTFASLNASTVTGNFEGTISITYMTSQ